MPGSTVTIERCRDAATVDRMLRHPVVRHRAWGSCLRAPSVSGLAEGTQWIAFTVQVDRRLAGGFLCDLLGPAPRWHSLLTPACRGAAALAAARATIEWMRTATDWPRITVELHAAGRSVRWWLAQLGFRYTAGGFWLELSR